MGALKRFLPWVARWVAPTLVRLYFTTIRIHDDPAIRPGRYRPRVQGLYIFWHDQQLAAMWHYRRRGACALISRHRDGEYIARVAQSLGIRTVRGSSTRGGSAALKELVDLARAGWAVALTPDGPRGPRHRVKPGILYLAQRTGLPIRGLAIGFSSFWTLRTWDRFRVPKPFSRGYCMWSDPVSVPPDFDEEARCALALGLEDALNTLCAEADRRAAARATRNLPPASAQ